MGEGERVSCAINGASFGTITGVSSMIVMFGIILGAWWPVALSDRTRSYVGGFSLLAALAGAGSVAFV